MDFRRPPCVHGGFSTKSGSGWKNVNSVNRRKTPVEHAGYACETGGIRREDGPDSVKSRRVFHKIRLRVEKCEFGGQAGGAWRPDENRWPFRTKRMQNPPIPSNFPGEKSAAAENGARHRNAAHGAGRGAAIRIFRLHSVNLISHRRKRGFFPEMGKASIPKSAATAAAGVRPARGFDERL